MFVIVAEEEEKDKEKRLNALMEKLKMKAGQLRSSAESAKILRMAITVGTCSWQWCLVVSRASSHLYMRMTGSVWVLGSLEIP